VGVARGGPVIGRTSGNGRIALRGNSLSSSSCRKPGIGMTAWFLEFGPKVAPLPPTTAGPDSVIFEASIAWLGPWAFRTGTQSASGKAVMKAKVKTTARLMRTSAVLSIQQGGDRPRCTGFMQLSPF
jgi:hypothetical protein